ncbi:DUF305 domain-containing protein [Nocardioides currus]|nr:DUF305 domain-containing protein [Nocardioides currus]
MRSHVAVLVAVLVALMASVAAAVAVRVTHDDGDRFDRRDGMMSSQWDRRTDRSGEGQRRGWRGPGGMVSGSGATHGMRAGGEYTYLAEMIAHHEEAVVAAQALERSERAQMRSFGEAIVGSQSAQIDQMQEWLADWYPDRSGQVDYQPMMRDLTGLEGDRLDRAFLEDMLGHHMRAVMMSQQLLMRGVATHDPVEVLAETIRDEQRAEVVQMRRWLRAWFEGGWQHGVCGGGAGAMPRGMPGGM